MIISRFEQFKMMTLTGRIWLIKDMAKIDLFGYRNNMNALGRFFYKP